MKKNYTKKTGKVLRSCLTALLAVVMAVPVTALSSIGTVAVTEPVEVEAADVELPEPIMSLDFERGFAGEEEDGIKVKESKARLMYEEVTDDAGNYVKGEDGKLIAEWTDDPVIFGTTGNYYYQTGTFGNQPTTYDDAEKGNVLILDNSMEAERIIKTWEDEVTSVPTYTGGFDETTGEPLDEEAAKASTLQEEFIAHSAVQINNPFAGLPLTEEYVRDEEFGPQWTKGVTISYWVKVPTVEPAEGEEVDETEILNDSVLFTFENIQRDDSLDQLSLDPNGENVTYEVNGWIKYEAAQAYDPADPMYAQGEQYTLTDVNTNESFTVLKDYGPLVRLTPDYPGTAENKIYFRDDEDDKTPDKTVNLIEDGKLTTAKLYELGANIYKDYVTLDTNEGSLVPRGYINGSMQIAASNSFHFKEDDYRSETVYDENGNPVGVPTDGAFDINPNCTDTYGKFRQLRHYNCYYYTGDGRVTDAPEVWHYVTCVIQNDWVQFYVDGEEVEVDELSYHGTDFGLLNAKKYFNKGFGMRYPFHIGWKNVAEWIEDGTFSSGPSNCVPQTMLEWLTDEDTVLYIGYEGCCAEGTEQNIGTLDNVLLDDIEFYDVPLSSEQAVALYDQAVAKKDEVNNKEVTPIMMFDFESDAIHTLPAGTKEVASNNADKVDTPEVVNEVKYGHVLKIDASKSQYTGAVQFENPYKGMTDITGATISYWVKTYADNKGRVADGVALSFIDEPKILEHGKIQPAQKDTATRTGLYSWLSCDAQFMAGLDTMVYDSLKNHFKQSTKKNGNTDKNKIGFEQDAYDLEQEWNARLLSMTEWHYVTMVVENSGITMYLDGVKHENNQEDDQGATFYGPRFFDGYYNRTLDMFSEIRLGTGNQTATSLMEFLTQEDTMGYFGFVYKLGSSTTYYTSALSLYDDVAFYDKALSDAEVQAIYADAVSVSSSKTAVAGEEVYPPNEDTPNPTAEPDPTPSPNDDKKTAEFKENAAGKVEATANGVTVTADKGVIPENATLVVNLLGTTSSAANYAAAKSALKAAGIDVDSMSTQLYDIHLEVDGKTVAPKGSVTVTLTPPSGYQASKTSVVRISDVKSMSTSVSGSSLVYDTESLGEFAVMQKKGANSITGTNPSTSGSSNASKTGDNVSVVVPVILLAVAFVAIMAIRRKEELMED